MRTLYVKQGGLMEDPEWHWEVAGEGEGETLKEVADDLARRDPGFRGLYDPEQLTMWGWRLALEPDGTCRGPSFRDMGR